VATSQAAISKGLLFSHRARGVFQTVLYHLTEHTTWLAVDSPHPTLYTFHTIVDTLKSSSKSSSEQYHFCTREHQV